MSRVVALVGPTAVGKSAIAVELAQSLDAEIVSCDSMQVYRQTAVLTQSPTHAQRVQVQHHLIDCMDPTDDFSVGEYRRMAAPVIDRLLSHGKRALVVGGTGLYLRSLTEGLCDAPPADVKVREQLWSECHNVGSVKLYNRLRGVDSAAAARIHRNDARRIIRALEVYALTGRPISSWWRQASAELLQGQVTVIGLTREAQSQGWLNMAAFRMRQGFWNWMDTNIFDVVMHTMQGMEYVLAEAQCSQADVALHPTIPRVNWWEFYNVDQLIRRGEEEAEAHLPEIKKLVFEA